MLIARLLQRPLDSLLHMERYVNKGSPSGFSRLFTTSSMYSPFGESASFNLPLFEFANESVSIFGDEHCPEAKTLLGEDESLLFPVHPDTQRKLFHEFNLSEFDDQSIAKYFKVIPTASGRTVYCDSCEPGFYFKLHYDGILGRVDRRLTAIKTIAGIEVSEILRRHVDRNPPHGFAFLMEPLGLVKSCESEHGIEQVGCIVRAAEPYPSLRARSLIPCFSLFSEDVLNPDDELLLVQLLESHRRPWEQLRDRIIQPLLQAYCTLVFELGLIPELNAQNLLIAIDEAREVVGIVIRDLHGFEKDFTIRRSLLLHCSFRSAPYKCIDRNIEEEYYFIRHSFSYDFKLGEYVFEELLKVVFDYFHISVQQMREEVKEIFRTLSQGRDIEHFHPTTNWYRHDNILLTSERPYVELKNPKFRFS